jgi:hypothetical protein
MGFIDAIDYIPKSKLIHLLRNLWAKLVTSPKQPDLRAVWLFNNAK